MVKVWQYLLKWVEAPAYFHQQYLVMDTCIFIYLYTCMCAYFLLCKQLKFSRTLELYLNWLLQQKSKQQNVNFSVISFLIQTNFIQ